MEKIYRLLAWLDIGQAVDWLQDLTATNLTDRDLLALCASRRCAVYTSADGIAGHDEAAEVVGQGIQRVCNPLALIRAGTETTAELTFEGPVFLDDEDRDADGDGFWAVWWASTPLRGRRALFRPDDIRDLADKINGVGGDTARAELEDLRQQLEQERAARQAAEQRAEQAESEAKPSHLLAIAALLELLKAPAEFPRPQGMNQEAIKGAILAQFPWRGLGKRSLEDIFAAANKAKTDAE